MNNAEKLSKTVSDFAAYISSLPEEKLRASKSIKWGAREVLCHIVFWHEQYVAITKSLLNHEKPKLLTGSFVENNALAVQKNVDVPVGKLVARLQKAQKELFPLYDQAKSLRIAFKEGGKVRGYAEAIERIEQHLRSHLSRLPKTR